MVEQSTVPGGVCWPDECTPLSNSVRFGEHEGLEWAAFSNRTKTYKKKGGKSKHVRSYALFSYKILELLPCHIPAKPLEEEPPAVFLVEPLGFGVPPHYLAPRDDVKPAPAHDSKDARGKERVGAEIGFEEGERELGRRVSGHSSVAEETQ